MDSMEYFKYRSKVILPHSYVIGDIIYCHKTGDHYLIEAVDEDREMYYYRILERDEPDQCFFEVLDYLVGFSKVA
jgi:hypothetical protein